MIHILLDYPECVHNFSSRILKIIFYNLVRNWSKASLTLYIKSFYTYISMFCIYPFQIPKSCRVFFVCTFINYIIMRSKNVDLFPYISTPLSYWRKREWRKKKNRIKKLRYWNLIIYLPKSLRLHFSYVHYEYIPLP